MIRTEAHRALRDWDAEVYDRVAQPQLEWGREVLDRLPLRGDETVLDAGCGSGRVTALLAERLPRGHVIAVDASPSMVAKASAALAGRAEVLRADLSELALPRMVDAVFSNAVFHWVPDHDVLFRRLAAVLRPGGRLVAQCGGEGNIGELREAVRAVAAGDPFAPYLRDWQGPWNFAGAGETEARLARAGFVGARCWLERWPVTPEHPRAYLEHVTLGPYLARLPERLQGGFVERVLDRLPSPPTLGYVRLNISARKAA